MYQVGDCGSFIMQMGPLKTVVDGVGRLLNYGCWVVGSTCGDVGVMWSFGLQDDSRCVGGWLVHWSSDVLFTKTMCGWMGGWFIRQQRLRGSLINRLVVDVGVVASSLAMCVG